MTRFLLRGTAVWVVAAGILATAQEAGPWTIVPGRKIGRVEIGMEHAEVLRQLGAPHHEEDLETLSPEQGGGPAFRGMLRDDWITPLPLKSLQGGESDTAWFLADFVTVYCVGRRVVQIEVHASRFQIAMGLGSASTVAAWRQAFPEMEKGQRQTAPHQSSGGLPNAKHHIWLDDCRHQGIAWRYGIFTGLAAEPSLDQPVETVLIHKPGEPAILDPDGGDRFLWKDYPTSSSKDLGK